MYMMAYEEWTRVLAALLLLLSGQSTSKYVGSDSSSTIRPKLKCHVEGINSSPGEAVTFFCTVTPTTAIRYCEFRPPLGGSPILLDDGVNLLIGSDIVDDSLVINSSLTYNSSAETENNLQNRTKRSHRSRYYGWSTRLDYVGKGFASGDCSAAIKKVSLDDAGIWRCIAGVEEQMVELSVKFDLVVHDGASLPLKTNIEVPDDWAWAILTCHTVSHRPLRYCRFLRNDGTQLISSTDRSEFGPGINLEAGVQHGRYMYHGNGLSTGDCGVSLSTLSTVDAGEWLCIVGVSGEEGHQKGVLTLNPPKPSMPGGLSLGAIMGIGLVSAFVLFVIIHEVIERRASWRDKKAQKRMTQKIAKADILAQNLSGKGKF